MARLAFFGTPNFSLPSLIALHRYCQNFHHELVMVVTQKDQPKDRGKLVLAPPVKVYAQNLNLTIWQPETLKKGSDEGDRFYDEFSSLNIDLAVVVAYGKIISERLLKIPRRGFVNVHASLLPRFRGAAPVQRAIEWGDKQTGVCLMDIVKKLDEGDVFACLKTPIIPSDNQETLFRRLANLGAHLLSNNLSSLLDGTLLKRPQENHGVLYASMVNKEEGALNFFEKAAIISRKVKAFDPWPGSFGFIRNKRVKFFASFALTDPQIQKDCVPGTVIVSGNFLGVKAQDGIVYFAGMQVEGKKALPIKEALCGFPIATGEKIMMNKL